jgi:hypothetical protein
VRAKLATAIDSSNLVQVLFPTDTFIAGFHYIDSATPTCT